MPDQRAKWRLTVLCSGVICLIGAGGCVELDGGAAEVSWALRTFEGNALDGDLGAACQSARLSAVELCWRDGSSTGEFSACTENRRRFPCDLGYGVTRFEIDEGPTSLRIFPVCLDGQVADIGTYEVPAPVVRTSANGQVMTLNSLLIVLWDSTNPVSQCAPAGCTCMR